jgi:hypothetical protein
MTLASRPVGIVRWLARALAVGLLAVWGAFFLEHLQEWFRDPLALPPPYVWAGQALHLLLLISFVAACKWELGGGLLIVLSTLAFFGWVTGGSPVALLLVTLLPGVLFILCGLTARRLQARAA